MADEPMGPARQLGGSDVKGISPFGKKLQYRFQQLPLQFGIYVGRTGAGGNGPDVNHPCTGIEPFPDPAEGIFRP